MLVCSSFRDKSPCQKKRSFLSRLRLSPNIAIGVRGPGELWRDMSNPCEERYFWKGREGKRCCHDCLHTSRTILILMYWIYCSYYLIHTTWYLQPTKYYPLPRLLTSSKNTLVFNSVTLFEMLIFYLRWIFLQDLKLLAQAFFCAN